MIAQLTAAVLASLALAQQTDTTFTVDAKGRMELTHLEGSVAVTSWNRGEMRVVATFIEDEGDVEIRTAGSTVRVEVKGEWGEPVAADLEITVPREMALEISGVTLEVGIEGAGGDVSVSTVEGGIRVAGGKGNIALNAVDGDVTLSGASGNMALNGVDGDISVADSEGNLTVNAVDGDVILEGIRSNLVEANAVDGDISYRGTIADGGRYFLSTHDGDLLITVPQGTNARVSVNTFAGDLAADFPIELEGDMKKRKFSFTLGSGKALMELSTFDGTIQLVRP